MDQRIGAQLGNYRIVEVIARGAYGIVYRAEQIHLDYSAAIKFIHADLNTPSQRASFRHEAQTLVKLRHPNIVRLLDFGIKEDMPYLVSDYAPGGSLRTYLLQQDSQPLPLRDARHILAQIGRALAYVHSQGIVHRDLKPENILFDSSNRALLADFGIARMARTVRTGSAGSMSSLMGLGTPPYMAPEQFKPKGEPLPESDQYALGCIAYELLTGQLPFTADNVGAYGFQHMYEPPPSPRLLNPTLPPRVEQAILTALAKDPAKRHTDVEAFLVELGIPRPAPTQVDLTSDAPTVVRAFSMSGSDDSTLIKQPGMSGSDDSTLIKRPKQTLAENDVMANRTLEHLVSSQQFATTHPDASESVRHTASSLWERARTLTAGESALIIAKRLFLFLALIDLLLLFSGFWFAPSFPIQLGTILAVGICICGLALNFFTEPWIWLLVFLLLSPLSGGLYTLAVNMGLVDNKVVNWHTYCIYLLLTPIAGILYGLFGPSKHRDESITPSFTKKLILTIWFLGAGFVVVGFGTPLITYIGLAWALASGILAAAQVIRLKQGEWITGMVTSLVFAGVPILFWGFAYGVFGPITEEQGPLDFF